MHKNVLASVLAVSSVAAPTFCGAEIASLSDIDISDTNRPLHEALLYIERVLKTPINYEEVRYGPLKPEQVPCLVVHFTPGERDATAAVQTVLGSYRASALVGTYAFTQHGRYLEVLPKYELKGRKLAPLSEEIISIPYGERTVAGTIELIARQVAIVSGQPVFVLNQPFVFDNLIQFSSDRLPAKLVLESFSDLVGPFSFHFVYDPEERTYYLNIQGLQSDAFSELVPTPKVKAQLTNRPLFTKPK